MVNGRDHWPRPTLRHLGCTKLGQSYRTSAAFCSRSKMISQCLERTSDESDVALRQAPDERFHLVSFRSYRSWSFVK